MNIRRILVAAVITLTLVLFSSLHIQYANAATGEINVVSNPGFEDPGCPAWANTSTIGGGVLKICDATNPHVPSVHSTLMNATQADAQTRADCPPGAGCKDFVRATVQQFLPLGSTSPDLDSLSTSSTSFSAWWYVDPMLYGMTGTYALHTAVTFRDTGTNHVYTMEYWYGISDLSPPNIFLGPIPVLGQWFQMTRNLTQDIQVLNVQSPAVTKVDNVMFASDGNVTHGQNAYLDDVSLLFVPHPVPLFSSNPALGKAPLTVSFDATGSTETTGGPGITNYTWTFGDGSVAVKSVNSRVSHTYTNPGNYTVVLTVTDANLQSRSISSKITVTGAPIGNEGLWGPAVAGIFGVVLVAGVLLLRGRSHSRKRTGYNVGRQGRSKR